MQPFRGSSSIINLVLSIYLFFHVLIKSNKKGLMDNKIPNKAIKSRKLDVQKEHRQLLPNSKLCIWIDKA
jgi:hypothetical protein